MFSKSEEIIGECEGTKIIVNDITKDATRYAQMEDLNGIKLDNWKVVLLEFPKGIREFALYDNEGNPITTSQQLEAIGTRIDMEKTKITFN